MSNKQGSKASELNFIDLFSGCGGLSLGFRWAGLFPLLSVERSAMAGETYYHNLIRRIPDGDSECWRRYCEDNKDRVERQLRGGLFIGPIEDLIGKYEGILDVVIRDKIDREVDIIAGGPPCQGFSCAGRRNAHDKRNKMPLHFLAMVEKFRPRAVVLENVGGFRHRFNRDGEPAAAEMIQEKLSQTSPGYVSQLLRLNAQHYGVPQHRPRVMIMALRRDVAELVGASGELPVWESGSDGNVESIFAPRPVTLRHCLSVRDALCDLDSHGYRGNVKHNGTYSENMRFRLKVFARGVGGALPEPHNHVLRKHCEHVVCRFSLYEIVRDYNIDRRILQEDDSHGGAVRSCIAEHLQVIPDADFPMAIEGTSVPIMNRQDLLELVLSHQTRKHSQRALDWACPSPTVMTLPDDFVHPLEPRTLTVREMARLQSFPDAFIFRAKETTGGKNRRKEVPQYTQVGNAVPPLLAKHVGRRLKALLQHAAIALNS